MTRHDFFVLNLRLRCESLENEEPEELKELTVYGKLNNDFLSSP